MSPSHVPVFEHSGVRDALLASLTVAGAVTELLGALKAVRTVFPFHSHLSKTREAETPTVVGQSYAAEVGLARALPVSHGSLTFSVTESTELLRFLRPPDPRP